MVLTSGVGRSVEADDLRRIGNDMPISVSLTLSPPVLKESFATGDVMPSLML